MIYIAKIFFKIFNLIIFLEKAILSYFIDFSSIEFFPPPGGFLYKAKAYHETRGMSHCSYVLDEIQKRRSKQAMPVTQSSSSNVVSSVLNVEHSIVKCASIGEKDEI